MNSMNDKKPSGKAYIYNKYQALFYMENNVYPIDIGVNYKTMKPYWCFKWSEQAELYRIWCERKH